MIPAKLAKSMVASYVFLILGTVLSFLGMFKFMNVISAASWAMVGGSVVCLYFMHFWIKKRMKFTFLNIDHVAILLSSLSIAWLSNVENIWIKIIGFGPFAVLLSWSFIIAGFISKKDVASYVSRGKVLVSKRFKK
jgi:hypothetical protein